MTRQAPRTIAAPLAFVRDRIGDWLSNSRKIADSDAYLRKCRGVIHIGANVGQERKVYAALGLAVLWIEPIPAVYEKLLANIARYPRQRALSALVTDADGEDRILHVASNGGASSSILELRDHKDIWPDVGYVDTLALKTVTLPTLLKQASIAPGNYDTLVLDTQGSELLVLKGASPSLTGISHIKTEAADFELYSNCTTVAELETYLGGHGFTCVCKDRFAQRPQGGGVYDLLFARA